MSTAFSPTRDASGPWREGRAIYFDRRAAGSIPHRPYPLHYAFVKRAMDLLIAVPLFVATLPMMLIIGLLIRVDSPGPALFRQTRIGRDGRAFRFYKFRTMYVDAPQRFPEMYAYNYSREELQTMYFKLIDDPRLTRLGQHLRRTSLDELPNLINVVLGNVSLVGPRPDIPEMVRYYRPDQMLKLTSKPGVTGLAQISGRGVLRFQETLAADLEYCRKRSLWLDLQILARTAHTVFSRVGAF